MTILNIWTTPDRAVIATDTLAQPIHPDAERFERSKMLMLPHANVVLASRGSTDVLSFVYRELHCLGRDFDQMGELLERDVVDRVKDAQAWMASTGNTARHEQDLFLVGWSAAKQRMSVRRFTVDESHRLSLNDPGGSLAPAHGSQRVDTAAAAWAQDPFADELLIDLARAQVQWADSTGQGGGFGGRLLCAKLTRHELHVQSLCADLRASD